MYSLNTLVIISISLLVVGLIFGYMLALKRTTAPDTQRKLEEQLEKLESQQQDYQSQVNEHFSDTAQLLNQLTDSYRDVHDHLAKGAQLLCGEHANDHLQRLVATSSAGADIEQLSPPLDYAPKTNDKQGMLSEAFGLEKEQQKAAEDDKVASPVIG